MGKPARTGLRLWDRLVLLTAWLVTCGFVYLLGFYTGKGTQERQLGLEERVVRLPVTSHPPAEGQRPKGSTDLTFYEKLVSGGSSAGAPAAAKPPPPADTPPAPPPSPVAKAVPATPPPPRTALSATLPPPRAATSPTAVPPAPAVLPRPAGGWWTVTANPTRDHAEAEDLMYRLKGRGYPVTLVRVLRDGDTWYRVQIGRYESAEQANEMMRRLRDQEGVAHAFVASD